MKGGKAGATHELHPCGHAVYGAAGVIIASTGRPVPVRATVASQWSRWLLRRSRFCLCSCHSCDTTPANSQRDRDQRMRGRGSKHGRGRRRTSYALRWRRSPTIVRAKGSSRAYSCASVSGLMVAMSGSPESAQSFR